MPAHGSTAHEGVDDDLDGAGNVALAGFPAAYCPAAFDPDQLREPLGA